MNNNDHANYPQFIAIDASSFEEYAHPVAIAWSMNDGQIKTTLIQPEDDWQDWDIGLQDIHGISQDTLYQRGETTWSVVRELDEDSEASLLYYNPKTDPYLPELLEKLYQSCERDVSLNLGFISELGKHENAEEHNHEQTSRCDERVYQMLMQYGQTS